MTDEKPPRKQPAKKPPTKKAPPKPRTPARSRAREGTHQAIASVTPITKPRAVGRHKTSYKPEAITVAERRGRALRYRRANWTWQQICDQLHVDARDEKIAPLPPHYDYRAVRRDVERMYDDLIITPTDEYIKEKLDQLQSIYTTLYTRMASNGKDLVSAALALQKNIHMQLQITGGYAPIRIAGADGGPLEFTLADNPAEIAEQVRLKLDRILPHEEPPAIEAEVIADG